MNRQHNRQDSVEQIVYHVNFENLLDLAKQVKEKRELISSWKLKHLLDFEYTSKRSCMMTAKEIISTLISLKDIHTRKQMYGCRKNNNMTAPSCIDWGNRPLVDSLISEMLQILQQEMKKCIDIIESQKVPRQHGQQGHTQYYHHLVGLPQTYYVNSRGLDDDDFSLEDISEDSFTREDLLLSYDVDALLAQAAVTLENDDDGYDDVGFVTVPIADQPLKAAQFELDEFADVKSASLQLGASPVSKDIFDKINDV